MQAGAPWPPALLSAPYCDVTGGRGNAAETADIAAPEAEMMELAPLPMGALDTSMRVPMPPCTIVKRGPVEVVAVVLMCSRTPADAAGACAAAAVTGSTTMGKACTFSLEATAVGLGATLCSHKSSQEVPHAGLLPALSAESELARALTLGSMEWHIIGAIR
jgi:hypothetical protein